MSTTVDEIADGIYRLSTWVPEIAPPAGFTFNQFLVDADEPLLFHTGPRGMFPLVSEAVARIIPVERLRWITFGHVEADECGVDERVAGGRARTPRSLTAPSAAWCRSTTWPIGRPRPLADGEVMDLGGKRVRHLDTPHVPHGWEARVLFEETTAHAAVRRPVHPPRQRARVTTDDIVAPAIEAEAIFRSTAPGARHRATHPPARRPGADDPRR